MEPETAPHPQLPAASCQAIPGRRGRSSRSYWTLMVRSKLCRCRQSVRRGGRAHPAAQRWRSALTHRSRHALRTNKLSQELHLKGGLARVTGQRRQPVRRRRARASTSPLWPRLPTPPLSLRVGEGAQVCATDAQARARGRARARQDSGSISNIYRNAVLCFYPRRNASRITTL